MVDISEIGLRIKELRKSKNLNQEEFVQDLGISRSALSLIESNSINCSLELLIKIVSKYNISLDWIIYGIEKHSNDYKIIESLSSVKEPNNRYNNKHPPGCEKCADKDKLLLSQQETIKALERSTLMQNDYIETLKEKIEELAEPGEKKRKVS